MVILQVVGLLLVFRNGSAVSLAVLIELFAHAQVFFIRVRALGRWSQDFWTNDQLVNLCILSTFESHLTSVMSVCEVLQDSFGSTMVLLYMIPVAETPMESLLLIDMAIGLPRISRIKSTPSACSSA